MRTFKTIVKKTAEGSSKAQTALGEFAKETYHRSSTLPKMYADAAIKHGESYYDYGNEALHFKTGHDYEFIRKLGKGKYSEVFESVDLVTNGTVVVKLIKPIKEEKI